MIWLALTAAAAFTLGYTACLHKPLGRLDTWAWDQIDRRARELRTGPARRRPGWYVAQAVFALEVAGALIVQPRATAAHIRETRARHRAQRERGGAS